LSEPEIECPSALRPAVEATLRVLDIGDCHLAVVLVDEQAIRELNRRFRGRDEPTDVLAFPIDGEEETPGPRELGDVVVCPERAYDLEEAVVHAILHLAGHDHETDGGEMIEVQRRVLGELRGAARP
jgi:probable rRNA maturation factor